MQKNTSDGNDGVKKTVRWRIKNKSNAKQTYHTEHTDHTKPEVINEYKNNVMFVIFHACKNKSDAKPKSKMMTAP